MTQTAAAIVSLHEPQRQSLMAIVFLALRIVGRIGIVQLAIGIGFMLARAPSIAWLFVVALLVGCVLLGIAGLTWWRYTFCVVNSELQVRSGVLSQQTLSVPLDRIQSVLLEQKVLHRPFDLVQVSVRTAGSDTAEFTIDALHRPVADALQRAAADHRRTSAAVVTVSDSSGQAVDPPPPQRPDRIVLQHPPRRIATIALTQMPLTGIAVVAPLLAVADDLADVVPLGLPAVDEPTIGVWLVWMIPLVILAVFVVGLILNLIRVVLTDWNLTVTSTAEGLRRNAGLLSTTSIASRIPRIQRVVIKQRLLEGMVGLHTVVLHTIGDGDFVIPGCDASQVDEIRALVLEDSDEIETLDRRVSSAEVFKAVRSTSIVSVVLVGAAFMLVGWWALLIFLSVPARGLVVRRQVRRRRWAATMDAIIDRQEYLGWSRQDLLLRKVNGVKVSQSRFERKRDLATVWLQTADGSMSIGMVGVDEARAIRDRALYIAETDRRAWM